MFHIPSERSRVTDGPMGSAPEAGNFGAFILESCEPGWALALICDDGRDPGNATGWEHVSVRAFQAKRSRVPTWREMCLVKDLCWDPEDVVMQLHPAQSQYINQHPDVLHLWRPLDAAIPTPDGSLVGKR